MKRISSLDIANKAYASLNHDIGDFLATAWLAMLVFAAVSAGWSLYSFHVMTEALRTGPVANLEDLGWQSFAVNAVLYIVTWLPFSLAWLRFAASDAAALRPVELHGAQRLPRFAFHAVLLVAITYAASALIAVIVGIFAAGSGGPAAFVFIVAGFFAFWVLAAFLLRLTLPLVGSALGHRIGYGESWRLTAGSTAGMFWLILWIVLPAAIALIAITFLTGLALRPAMGNIPLVAGVHTVVSTLAMFALGAIGLKALALLYERFLSGDDTASAQDEAQLSPPPA